MIDQNKIRELINRYIEGENVRDLAVSLSVSVQTIYNTLKKENVRRRGERTLDISNQLVEAMCQQITLKNAAKVLGISDSTAARIIRKRREKGEQIRIMRGRPKQTRPKSIYLVQHDSVDDHYKRLCWTQFPYPVMLSVEEFRVELDRLRGKRLSVDEGGVIGPRSPIGLKICSPFFPNRFEAVSKRSLSAIKAWQTESELRKAIKFQLKYGDPVVPERIRRVITLRCRTPTIFRPAVARFVYERYCPSKGRVWDPCIGYGGRLLGAFVAGVKYVGTDVDERTLEGNQKLAEVLGADVDLHLISAELFNGPQVDFVFTSPPYFDREQYSQKNEQSWKKFGNKFDAWANGFIGGMAKRAYEVLLPGRYFVLNVADLKEHKKTIPIVARVLEEVSRIGFVHVETLYMPLAAINRTSPTEPLLVFQKQN